MSLAAIRTAFVASVASLAIARGDCATGGSAGPHLEAPATASNVVDAGDQDAGLDGAPDAGAEASSDAGLPSEDASSPGEDASSPSEDAAAPPVVTPPEDGGAPQACAPDMAEIGPYCIDRYEAHLVVLGRAGETPHPHNERPPLGVPYAARSAPGVFPQAYVNRAEAALACANAGKRLCSWGEWRRACEGEERTVYPYGDRYQPGACNTAKRHILTLRHGRVARTWTFEDFNDPSLDAEPGFLEQTGEREECVSSYGVYDLVGNVHEWVSDPVDDAFISRVKSQSIRRSVQGHHDGNGVFLGGFFSNTNELGPGCKYITYGHDPSYHDYSTGFRCCSDAYAPTVAPGEPSMQPDKGPHPKSKKKLKPKPKPKLKPKPKPKPKLKPKPKPKARPKPRLKAGVTKR